MMSMMGGSSSTAAPAFDFNFGIEYSDFNDAPAVEAPDDVQTVLSAENAFRIFGLDDMTGTGAIPPAMTPTPVEPGAETTTVVTVTPTP
jgi:hypothetical protein